MNEKAKTYVVGFFNGDLKVFSKHNHEEVLSIKQLHQDSIIEDAIFLRNDAIDKKIVVSCSSLPNPDLKVSEVSIVHKGPGGKAGKEYVFNVLAQSKDELNVESFKCLSNNPVSNEYICSGGVINHKNEEGSLT